MAQRPPWKHPLEHMLPEPSAGGRGGGLSKFMKALVTGNVSCFLRLALRIGFEAGGGERRGGAASPRGSQDDRESSKCMQCKAGTK